MRHVIQEIADAPDAESTERLGALRPDGFQVLDRRREGKGHESRTRRRAYAPASNGSRSSTPSPVATNRTGSETARRSAITLPPLAVPSSLVTTRPVSGIAW